MSLKTFSRTRGVHGVQTGERYCGDKTYGEDLRTVLDFIFRWLCVDDFCNIKDMRHYRWIALTGGIGIAAALFLYAAKTDGMNVMTGPKAFTNTASLSPGLARKITAQDLPQSRPLMVLPRLGTYLAAGFTRGGARPESAIPKAPAGFKLNIYVASGLTIPRQMRRAPNGDIFMVDLLRDSFYALKRQAAPGVDGVIWHEYKIGLEDRLTDLHSRVHRGAYRARPSRRVYIPKADGRQRPLGIAALRETGHGSTFACCLYQSSRRKGDRPELCPEGLPDRLGTR